MSTGSGPSSESLRRTRPSGRTNHSVVDLELADLSGFGEQVLPEPEQVMWAEERCHAEMWGKANSSLVGEECSRASSVE